MTDLLDALYQGIGQDRKYRAGQTRQAQRQVLRESLSEGERTVLQGVKDAKETSAQSP